MGQQAVTFTQAITATPLTMPSHASLLTSLDPPRHGVRDNQVFSLSPSIATYPAALKSQGYATGAFVSAVVLNRRFGLNSGFDVYDDEMSGPERPGAETLGARPRLAGLGAGAVLPVDPPLRAARTLRSRVATTRRSRPRMPSSGSSSIFSARKGIWDKAVLSVTSDHGESLGEHGEQTHGFFVYDATLRIPWLLKAPELRSGRYPHQVRIVDVLPTMTALAGANPPPQPADGKVDGISLERAPVVGGDRRPRGLQRDLAAARSVRVELAVVDSTGRLEVHRRRRVRSSTIFGAIRESAATSSPRDQPSLPGSPHW